jgi:glycerol-3-phosphate O-acyltransferase
VARFIYTRSYEKNLDINLPALEELRELSKDNLLLFLWSHKSHMDSFVFLLSLYDNGFRPIPLIFAGINMNFLGFGALARRVGAIFLRRSFQDDPIYKLVFRHYIDYLIRNRLPLTWSIEGTRSRTGKLSPPKLGILNWVLEACERENMRDVKLVPVSIAFDRIAEIDDYVALQQGMPKRKESLRWFVDFIFRMREPFGKIYVRYAEPVSLDSLAPGQGAGEGAEPSLATRLAFDVCTRIEQITPIKSADVLTMVLLAANGRALSRQEILQQAREIAGVIRERELPVASGFSLESEDQVAAAILSMRSSGLVKRFDKGRTPVYYIPEEEQLAAAYYRNTITHFFLASAIGEVALAQCIGDAFRPSEAALHERIDALRDLFKFEFFFQPKDVLWQQVIDDVSRRYPDWLQGSAAISSGLTSRPPRFGHAILRSIAEAYLVTAQSLVGQGVRPVTDRKRFSEVLLSQGREMLLRRKISGESAISKDLFAVALQLADHRGLLQGDASTVAAARADLASELKEALAAIDRLQAFYDASWFDDSA